MGIGKRLLDIARSNLTALLTDDKVERTEGGLGDFSDEELAAELQLRRDRRRRQDQARAAREAAERAARERAQREAERRASTGAQTAAGAGAHGSTASGKTTSGRGQARAGAVPPGSTVDHARIHILYARLETPYGADLATVKGNFRRLMRQHHPDLAGGSASHQKQATEVTAQLTAAYTELEQLLTSKPR